MTLRVKAVVTVLSSVFPAASPLTRTTQPTRLCSCQSTHTRSELGFRRALELSAIMCQHLKARALSCPTTPGCCSLGPWSILTRFPLLPYNKNCHKVACRIHDFPIKNRFRISLVCQGLKYFGCSCQSKH